MHQYRMLDHGDSVLVAVSGGVDSLVLAAILTSWRSKAPIDYSITAVHIDLGLNPDGTEQIKQQLDRLQINSFTKSMPFDNIKIKGENQARGEESCCFVCARKRRNLLFKLAKEKQCNKLALGHHQEDIIETFFLNMLYSGNLSTMVPHQKLFNGELGIIRPLAFLDKNRIREAGKSLQLKTCDTGCPMADKSKRQTVRSLLQTLYSTEPQIKSNIFRALGNIRQTYLL